jgi:hypothetical protein
MAFRSAVSFFLAFRITVSFFCATTRALHTQPNTENARGVVDIQWRGVRLTHALYVLNVLLTTVARLGTI